MLLDDPAAAFGGNQAKHLLVLRKAFTPKFRAAQEAPAYVKSLR
jgi:hypothetical protein